MKLLTPDPSPAEVTILLFLHRALAAPSPASDYLEDEVGPQHPLASHPAATFYLRAEGEHDRGRHLSRRLAGGR